MHKYFFHVGDFNRATRHLTRIERSVYRDLIDLYMDTELPLTPDLKQLCRLILATSEQESTAVEQVLNEFFILTQKGWFNSRCDSEILNYQSISSKASLAGKASAAAKALRKQQVIDSNGRSTDVQRTFNEKPTESQLTNNLEPVTIDTKKKPKTPKAKPPLALTRFADFWKVYPRRDDKAKAEISWSKQNLDEIADDVIVGAKAYAKVKQGAEIGFIALPTTWLNGKRWRDEAVAVAPIVEDELTEDQKLAKIKDEEAERREYDRQHMKRMKALLVESP